MADQERRVFDVGDQIFGAAAERGDPAGRQAVRQSVRGRESADSGRRVSTRSIRAPSSTGCSPRRTVSTSGSSGMGGDRCEEGRAVPAGRKAADARRPFRRCRQRSCRRPMSPPRRPGAMPMTGMRSRVWSVPRQVGSLPWSAVRMQQVAGPAALPAPPAGAGRTPRARRHSRRRRGDDRIACRNRRNWRRPGRRRAASSMAPSVSSNSAMLPTPLRTSETPRWAKMSPILPMPMTVLPRAVSRSSSVGSGGGMA